MADSPTHVQSVATQDQDRVKQKHEAEVAAHLSNDDARDINAIGKQQVFVRKFGFWSVLGIAVCTSGTWEGITAAVAQALYSGGSTALLYGYIAAALGAMLLVLSMAEMASIWPTTGGLYHWIVALCPHRLRGMIGFLTGYILLGTGWFGVTSAISGVALQIQAYVMVSNPDYAAERWHTVLIFWAAIFLAAGCNMVGGKVIKYLNIVAMVLHVVAYVVIIIVLLACTPEKHSAEYVFTSFENYSGWSDGMAWCIGLLSSVYGFVGIETATYFSEETIHASVTVPRAMIANVAVNAVVTFPFIIVFLFCLGDLDSVLMSPIGAMSPTTQIYINSTGSVAAGIILNATATLVAFVSAVDAMGSGARVLFALARDSMFPTWLAVVSPRFDVPIRALFVVTLPPMLLILIYLGNATAFYGFMSGILVSMIIIYLVPISFIFMTRLRKEIAYGPISLGKFGTIINGAALIWFSFVVIALCFPSVNPVTVENMNYAIVFFGGVLVLSLVCWFAYGRTSSYHGPVLQIDIEGIAVDQQYGADEESTDKITDS
ncbi:amino acid transporter [Thozetella sp. PMI_491]|nr:amino acid transporter [Thozetella sp. PMI_491]